MMYVTLGQFNIPVAWLAFIFAVFYSDFRSKKADPATNKVVEYLVFLYLLFWKLSYILFSWTDFVKAPLSLLYFDGGFKGHLLALLAIAFMLYRNRHVLVWIEIWTYWARFVAIYHIISSCFQEQWLIAVLWFMLLIFVERKYNHWILLGQYVLLAWLEGFTGSFTLAQLLVIFTIYLKTRQSQYIALMAILSLIAVMLGDVEKAVVTTESGLIELPTTTGETYRLTEQEQEITVVNFFATWCPPCKAEMPHLQSFAKDLPAGVALIGVNLTERDNGQQALDDFMETYDVSYPILLDERDDVGTAFQVLSIPTTVLLNSQGEEVERIVGPVSEESLHRLIKRYQ